MLFLWKSPNRLVYKLIVSILLFSGAITVLITAIQLYAEYRRDVNEIDTFISKIEKSFVVPIASGLWNFDMESVRLQLDGMLRFRDIEYLEITEKGNTIVSVGSRKTKHVISRNIPLTYNYKNQDRKIGKLTVTASLAGVYSRLFDRAISILISQGMKTFLVSGFILMIFHLLVTRHLGSINSYLKSLDIENLPRPLRLKRRVSTKHDELDQVVNSTNEMIVNLHESYQTINTELELRKQAEEKLSIAYKDIEKRVEERTAELVKANEQLKVEMEERKLAEEALEQLFETWGLAQKMAKIGNWSYNIETQQPIWSEQMFMVLGCDPEKDVPNYEAHKEIFHSDDWAMFDKAVQGAINGIPYNIEARIICTDGSIHWCNAQGFPRYDQDGNVVELFGTTQDITERKLAEEQIKSSLKEKEVLIQELYHRTKNNMQVIISMLHLQSRSIEDNKVLQIFKEMENRIKSMALVHQKLYQTKDLSRVDLKEYFHDLLTEVHAQKK